MQKLQLLKTEDAKTQVSHYLFSLFTICVGPCAAIIQSYHCEILVYVRVGSILYVYHFASEQFSASRRDDYTIDSTFHDKLIQHIALSADEHILSVGKDFALGYRKTGLLPTTMYSFNDECTRTNFNAQLIFDLRDTWQKRYPKDVLLFMNVGANQNFLICIQMWERGQDRFLHAMNFDATQNAFGPREMFIIPKSLVEELRGSNMQLLCYNRTYLVFIRRFEVRRRYADIYHPRVNPLQRVRVADNYVLVIDRKSKEMSKRILCEWCVNWVISCGCFLDGYEHDLCLFSGEVSHTRDSREPAFFPELHVFNLENDTQLRHRCVVSKAVEEPQHDCAMTEHDPRLLFL